MTLLKTVHKAKKYIDKIPPLTYTHPPTYLPVRYDIKHGSDLLCASDREHNWVGVEMLILPQSLAHEVSHKMKLLHRHTSSTNHVQFHK